MERLLSITGLYPIAPYLYALVGNVFMSFMQIFTKQLTLTLSSFQVLLLRSFFLLLFNALVLSRVGCSPYIPSPDGTPRLIQPSRCC
jgi:hypothetical protein